MSVMVILLMLVSCLCLYVVLNNRVNDENVDVVEDSFTTQQNLVESQEVEVVTIKKKNAFIEWDDDEYTHTRKISSHKIRTSLSDKIQISLNRTDVVRKHQTPPTNFLFKVDENLEGVEFLCSCINRGDIETVVMTMYELSKEGDTGEIYQYLDEKFNLSKLLFDYTY